MNKEMFNLDGPQVASVEAGCEPSLRDMIVKYYRTAFDKEDAEALADDYIEHWLFENAEDYLSLYKCNARIGDTLIQNRDGSLNFSVTQNVDSSERINR